MSKKIKTAISPTRDEDYPKWYQQIIKAADLAENSPVRGCMVIKPWGYAIWENIVNLLDEKFKSIGVKNAYFPLFIPLSFLAKEARHVEGFAKECAVVSHHRLEQNAANELVPAGKLTEPLIIRPTSETIIMDSFKKWITSYRDLPLLINQWSNVVRWEMRTRMFLRTSEFLWQEGHTAHASRDEAVNFTSLILNIYQDLAENYMAIPVIKGSKTPAERFPGADETLTIEAMMQDYKALQSGTSHFLGQNFAKAAQINFQNAKEKEEFVWTTSWGASTRLIGGLIMTHSDDNGLILPPKIASSHVVLLPIIRKEVDKGPVMEFCEALAKELRNKVYHQQKIGVEIDNRDIGGARSWEWIKKGIPLRVEIGPRDIAADSVFLARRDKDSRDKITLKRETFIEELTGILDEIQENLFNRALSYQKEHSQNIDDKSQFYEFFTPKAKTKPEIHGGFAFAHWCQNPDCESRIKDDLNVTIRCIPFSAEPEDGNCIYCGKDSKKRVLFAKAY